MLRDISGRLHDAADFVRFHSVCKPWRCSHDDAAPPLFRTIKTTQFLPWLLAPTEKDMTTPLKLRCIFSKSSYRAPAPPPHPMPRRRNWISSADGTAVCHMTVEHLRPSLHDPINGEDVIQLPRFRWDEGDPHGIHYGDGTILLYTVYHDNGTSRFRAALLRPSSAKWTLVKRTFEIPRHGEFCVTYHHRKILVTFEATRWHVITPDGGVSGDVLLPRPPSGLLYGRHNSYILVSRNELLWILINSLITSYRCGEEGIRHAQNLSMSVYVLEEEKSLWKKARWVKKDPCSLADRVLFLGSPNSFAIDASQLGSHGGCAFFVYSNTKGFWMSSLPGEQFGVLKYNFIERKSEFMERLPPGWGDEKGPWLVLQPAIAPIKEITKRSVMAQEWKQQQTVASPTRDSHMVRHYEPSFMILVRNLPISVESSQLQLFFSSHGRVSHSKVVYYEKTNTCEGILTITTVHAHLEEAVDALNGLFFDGYKLKVSLIKEENRRRRHGRLLPQ